MHPNIDTAKDARVGVVGAGRVGTALSAALRAAGIAVAGPAGRGEVPRDCHAIVLCVPDDAIPDAAAAVAGAAPLVGHTSGATPLARAGGRGRRALRPASASVDPRGRGGRGFRGAGCAVAGAALRRSASPAGWPGLWG